MLFANNNKLIVSASDDRTIRFWDRTTNQVIKKLELPFTPSDIELSRDGDLLSVASGCTASFWNLERLEKSKEYTIPTKVHSVTVHPNKDVFVCGGEDFKMYKYNYEDGTEIGEWPCDAAIIGRHVSKPDYVLRIVRYDP